MVKIKYSFLILILISILIYGSYLEKQYKENKIIIQSQKLKIVILNRTINKFCQFYEKVEPIYPNPIHAEDYVKLTSPFGIRKNPLKEKTGGPNETDHKAIDETGRQVIKEDIEGTWMARVISVADGRISSHYLPEGWHDGKYYSGYDDSDGYIIIKHFDGRESRYLHLGETYVHEGQIVKAGDVIGRISEKTSGKSTGPHLHFELLDKNGNYLQPLKYIEY